MKSDKKEKHILWFRPEMDEEPKKVGEYRTYKEALIVGMAECGRRRFWVENLHKDVGNKWVPFCPKDLRLSDLAAEIESEPGIVPVLDREALEEDLLPQ